MREEGKKDRMVELETADSTEHSKRKLRGRKKTMEKEIMIGTGGNITKSRCFNGILFTLR